MTLLTTREAAIDLLTTHRHGEDKAACGWCAARRSPRLRPLLARVVRWRRRRHRCLIQIWQHVGPSETVGTWPSTQVVYPGSILIQRVCCDDSPSVYLITEESLEKSLAALRATLADRSTS